MNGINYNLSNLCNDEFMRYLLTEMHLATFISFIFISFIAYLVDSHALTTKRKARSTHKQMQNDFKHCVLRIATLYIMKNFRVHIIHMQ